MPLYPLESKFIETKFKLPNEIVLIVGLNSAILLFTV